MDIQEYYQVIQDLARYQFGRGYYTQPVNTSQLFQVENLQFELQEKYPDLKSAKQALKAFKKHQ